MASLPWVLQEMMGQTRPRRSKRAKKLTIRTPATFWDNWGFCENGPTDPRPMPGVSTFMGVPKRMRAGRGKKWPDNCALALQAALGIARGEGLKCELPPDGYTPEEDGEMTTEDPELEYLRNRYHERIEVKKDGETALTLSANSDWVFIRCSNEEASDMVEERFSRLFALGRVRHEEKTVPIRDGLEVTVRTGNGKKGVRFESSVGTLFELKKDGKVISKALCAYENGEMDASGPTIEQFETASEWQRHGYGSELMAFMEGHFENIFEQVANMKLVKFNVCYVTNQHACEWFLSQGFRNWDGMGEELGKYLFH